MNMSLVGNQVLMNFRKELWEFKKTIVWTPMMFAGLILLMSMLGLWSLDDYQMQRISGIFQSINDATEQNITVGLGIFVQKALALIFLTFIIISLFIQLYYFLSCLFDEKRDLSIFFWRSLPVSDLQVIIVKLLTGAIFIPAFFMLVATGLIAIFMLGLVVLCIVLSLGYDLSIWAIWSDSGIFGSLAMLWLNLPQYSLWLFPLFAWLILASSVAKKSPFLWATLPFVFLLIVEGTMEYLLNIGGINISQSILAYLSFTPDMEEVFRMLAQDTLRDKSIPVNLEPLDYISIFLNNKMSIVATLVGALMIGVAFWLRKQAVR